MAEEEDCPWIIWPALSTIFVQGQLPSLSSFLKYSAAGPEATY